MRSLLGLLLVLAGPAGTAVAADYWVKNGGNDAAPGLSPATAWATLGHAAAVVNPGDTVHVLDGSYQGFDLRRSGTAGNPITFLAQSPSTLITADNPDTPDGINVEDAAHIVLDGFTVNDRCSPAVDRSSLAGIASFMVASRSLHERSVRCRRHRLPCRPPSGRPERPVSISSLQETLDHQGYPGRGSHDPRPRIE